MCVCCGSHTHPSTSEGSSSKMGELPAVTSMWQDVTSAITQLSRHQQQSHSCPDTNNSHIAVQTPTTVTHLSRHQQQSHSCPHTNKSHSCPDTNSHTAVQTTATVPQLSRHQQQSHSCPDTNNSRIYIDAFNSLPPMCKAYNCITFCQQQAASAYFTESANSVKLRGNFGRQMMMMMMIA